MAYISDLNFKNNIVPHKLNLLYAGCGTGKTEWATKKVFQDFPDIKPCETLLIVPKTWIAKQQAEKMNVYRYVSSEREMSDENKKWRDYWNGVSDEVDNENVVNVLTYATLINVLRNPESNGHLPFERIKLVIIDECHSLFTETYMTDLNVMNLWLNMAIKATDTLFVGITATPAIVKEYAEKAICSPINQVNKEVIMNYKAKNLIITDKETIPCMLNSGFLTGKTLIMCNSIEECKCLSYIIEDSAYIVSEYNGEYTSDMADITKYILEKNTIPDTFKGKKLKVLLSTAVLREGITFKKDCGIENVVCMSGCDINIIQIAGRCRYNIKNLVVVKPPIILPNTIDYVKKKEMLFRDFCKNRYADNGWFDGIRHVLSFNDIEKIQYKTKEIFFCEDIKNIPKNSEALLKKSVAEKLNAYIERNLKGKFVTEKERKEAVKFMCENSVLSGDPDKITPQAFYKFIEINTPYTLEPERKRVNGKLKRGCSFRKKRSKG